jgi:ATP-binding cassette subfamily F protein 3
MLHITDLTYRIAGRVLLENASLTVPAGHKVGILGRNGTGKTTLYKLVLKKIVADDGIIKVRTGVKVGTVAQEAPAGATSLLDTVLESDLEAAELNRQLESAEDPNKIAEIHERLYDLGYHTAEARAATILSGLGFDGPAQRRACSEFSGGWRMRVALACTLFTQPDLLLLDEPTNYLDLEGVLWLENFVKNYPHTILIISHDRDLLCNSVNSIIHLEHKKLKFYGGNLEKFEKTYAEQKSLKEAHIKKQTAERAHIQSFIDRFAAKASKAKQAQSRVKMLERMGPVQNIMEEDVAQFHFPNPVQLPPPLITMEGASVGYEEGKPILRNLNLRIDMEDRIALLGQNGNGKSTFAKLLSERLDVMEGDMRRPPKLNIGYFAQHQTDELHMDETPLQHLQAAMKGEGESRVRARLGQFGFGAEKATTIVGKLSGGEKARLLFSLMSFQAPQMLILDEPTNHLDMDSRRSLIHAINEYKGCVILITHDPYLLEACADQLWVVADGTVKKYDGDIHDYKKDVLSARGVEDSQKRAAKKAAKDAKKKDKPKVVINVGPLKKELKEAEKQIAHFTKEVKKYTRALTNPKLYDPKNPQGKRALVKFTTEKIQLETKLAEQEAIWMELSEKIEKAGR